MFSGTLAGQIHLLCQALLSGGHFPPLTQQHPLFMVFQIHPTTLRDTKQRRISLKHLLHHREPPSVTSLGPLPRGGSVPTPVFRFVGSPVAYD